MTTLTIATRNARKTQEFAELLARDVQVTDLTGATHIPLHEETGSTFEENAAGKAIAASRYVTGLVAADDSGLEVDALGGAPGIYSARYAGVAANDSDNVAKLLRELERIRVRDSAPRARFRCVIALAQSGTFVAAFTGTVEGTIASAPRGVGGFGYDPVFVPDGYAQTFAELGSETKNRISHRAQAAAALSEFLRTKRCSS